MRLAVFPLLFVSACYSNSYRLDLVGPLSAVAVGVTVPYHLQYVVQTYPCVNSKASVCWGSSPTNDITGVTEVSVDDPSIFEVERRGGDLISGRALAPGVTTLRASGLDKDGKTVRMSRTVRAQRAERAELSRLCGVGDRRSE